MLKYEIPALYEVIMRMTPKSQYPEPKVKIIEMVCRVSNDPSLSKAKFARYLEEYRNSGLCCHRAQTMTKKREIYYKSIRQRKYNSYIEARRREENIT